MNIKDFSFNSAFNNLGNSKISQKNTNYVKKKASSDIGYNARTEQNKRGSVTRERINLNPRNLVIAEDGSTFDKSAPKGSYINIVI